MFGFVDVSDHGALDGLADDDHPQYLLIDGTRAMTGALQTADALGVPGDGGLTTSGDFTQVISSGKLNSPNAVGLLFHTSVAGVSGSTAFSFVNGPSQAERFYIKKENSQWGFGTKGHAAIGENAALSTELLLHVAGELDLGAGLSASGSGMSFDLITVGVGTFQKPVGAKFNVTVRNSGVVPLPVAIDATLIQDGSSSWANTPGQATPAVLTGAIRSAVGSASLGDEVNVLQIGRAVFLGGVPRDCIGIDVFAQGTNLAQTLAKGIHVRNQDNVASGSIPQAIGILVELQQAATENHAVILEGDGLGANITFGSTRSSTQYDSGSAFVLDCDLQSVGSRTFNFLNGNLDISTLNIVTDTVTGTIIGTSTTQKLGFFNAAPVVQPPAYTITNPVVDRAYDVSATSTAELAAVLGTLIADLQSLGIVG